MILTSVDLPAPLSPISPSTSPGSSVRFTSFNALIAPKLLETSVSCSTAKNVRPPPGRCVVARHLSYYGRLPPYRSNDRYEFDRGRETAESPVLKVSRRATP